MKKTLMIGYHKIRNRLERIFLQVKIDEKGVLTISGEIGPRSTGNCRGAWGQIIDCVIDKYNTKEGWTEETVQELLLIWKCWHLNDLNAGTPKQMGAISHLNNHEQRCETLKAIDLYEDDGHIYGSKWLKVELPHHVMLWFHTLNNTSHVHPWRSMV